MIRPPPRSTLFPYTTSSDLGLLVRRRRRRQPPGRAGEAGGGRRLRRQGHRRGDRDRKSTRLNSSHANISYAVFCLKKKISQATLAPQADLQNHSRTRQLPPP